MVIVWVVAWCAGVGTPTTRNDWHSCSQLQLIISFDHKQQWDIFWLPSFAKRCGKRSSHSFFQRANNTCRGAPYYREDWCHVVHTSPRDPLYSGLQRSLKNVLWWWRYKHYAQGFSQNLYQQSLKTLVSVTILLTLMAFLGAVHKWRHFGLTKK